MGAGSRIGGLFPATSHLNGRFSANRISVSQLPKNVCATQHSRSTDEDVSLKLSLVQRLRIFVNLWVEAVQERNHETTHTVCDIHAGMPKTTWVTKNLALAKFDCFSEAMEVRASALVLFQIGQHQLEGDGT